MNNNNLIFLILLIVIIVLILYIVFKSDHKVHHDEFDHVHVNGIDGPSNEEFQALADLVEQKCEEIDLLTSRLDDDTRGQTINCQWNGDPVAGSGILDVIMDITNPVPSWIDPTPGVGYSFSITEAGVYDVGFTYLIEETVVGAPPMADVAGGVLLLGFSYISGTFNNDMNDVGQNRGWNQQTSVSATCIIPESALPVNVRYVISSAEGIQITVTDNLNNRGWITKVL